MAYRRANRRNYAFADAGDYGFFTCAAHKTIYVRANRNLCLCAKLDSVLGYGGYNRRFDNLRINAHLDCVEYVAARKVYRARLFKIERYTGTLRSNERIHDAVDISARKVVGLKLVYGKLKPRLRRLYHRVHYALRHNLPYSHAHELEYSNVYARCRGRYPEAYREERQKHNHKYECGNYYRHESNGVNCCGQKKFHHNSSCLLCFLSRGHKLNHEKHKIEKAYKRGYGYYQQNP